MIKIYIPIISYVTECFRPVDAHRVRGKIYLILSDNRDFPGEEWIYDSGDLVKCKKRKIQKRINALVACSAHKKKQKINKLFIKSNLLDAKEAIEKILKEMQKIEYYDIGNFCPDMQNIYVHINSAWKGKYLSEDEILNLSPKESDELVKMPEEF